MEFLFFPDKTVHKVSPIVSLMFFYVITTKGCTQVNISCNGIKTDNGFLFTYDCPEESESLVYDNKTTIAHRKDGTNFTPAVISINSNSTMTRECRDLQVKCFISEGKQLVHEICWDFTITEMQTTPEPSYSPMNPKQWDPIISVSVCLAVLIGIIIVTLCCLYISWKRKQQGGVGVSEFFRYLRTSCSCREGNFLAERREAHENGVTEYNAVPVVQPDDSETQQNNVMRQSVLASKMHGSGDYNIEQNNTLRRELVDSIDPNADGQTPQSLSLDRNLSNGCIQLTINEDIRAPDINRAFNHRAMNGGVTDDPGGVNKNTGKDTIGMRDMSGGLLVTVGHGLM
ncbi:uncharacterized protein LOC121956238 [Plectropomus leopardus]|uniref:uncharacterized protein LOC121956238 n=1 Tax=Plectropomus leopardus TaxID=160734 RepID=UPI001C4BE762|nr:uncharacterized protein LOC121956238 [Plectropomus leopardus]